MNMLMNPLWNGNGKPKDANRNLVKKFVFKLFPHLHQIRINARDHPFDLKAFLNVIQRLKLSRSLPKSLVLITIEGKWMVDSVTKLLDPQMKKQFSKAKIHVEILYDESSQRHAGGDNSKWKVSSMKLRPFYRRF